MTQGLLRSNRITVVWRLRLFLPLGADSLCFSGGSSSWMHFCAPDRKQTVGYLQFTQPNRGVSRVWEMWIFLNASRLLCVNVASSGSDHPLSLVPRHIHWTDLHQYPACGWSEGPFGLNGSLVGVVRQIYPLGIWHIDPKASCSETANQSTFSELTRCDERSPPASPLSAPPPPAPSSPPSLRTLRSKTFLRRSPLAAPGVAAFILSATTAVLLVCAHALNA